jgi:preprotein translocase subunit SecF
MIEIIKSTVNIDFLGKSKLFFIISGVLLILSIGVIFTKGFNYGIDFAGGTLVQINFEKEPNLNTLRDAFKEANLGEMVIQTFGEPNDILIRVEKSEMDLNDVANIIQSKIAEVAGEQKFTIERVEQVGPQVGDQLKSKAIMAIIYSLIGILIYVSLRFEFMFSLGAVVALFHDVIITLGVFSFLGKEITLPIVAALLTIVGYSLNDTIVVFDRIRERIKESSQKEPIIKIMNKSVNETLSRTILTSGTTLLAVIALYLFGGEVINGFSFALLIGIVIGTYSSIGIASSLVYVIKERKKAEA